MKSPLTTILLVIARNVAKQMKFTEHHKKIVLSEVNTNEYKSGTRPRWPNWRSIPYVTAKK